MKKFKLHKANKFAAAMKRLRKKVLQQKIMVARAIKIEARYA